jgi:hypothetical protein
MPAGGPSRPARDARFGAGIHPANDNPQASVREAIVSRLEKGGLQEAALVRANGSMLSLALQRQIEGAAAIRSPPTRFERWVGCVHPVNVQPTALRPAGATSWNHRQGARG